MIHLTHKNQNGYAAISSILVIIVVITLITSTASLASIDELQSSFAQYKGKQALQLVESCIEHSLLELNEENSISSTVNFPEGTCSVTLDSQSGDTWTFTTTATLDTYTKSVQVSAQRTSTVEILSWQEL
jgi:Tfp pilus assembly protein PilX